MDCDRDGRGLHVACCGCVGACPAVDCAGFYSRSAGHADWGNAAAGGRSISVIRWTADRCYRRITRCRRDSHTYVEFFCGLLGYRIAFGLLPGIEARMGCGWAVDWSGILARGDRHVFSLRGEAEGPSHTHRLLSSQATLSLA